MKRCGFCFDEAVGYVRRLADGKAVPVCKPCGGMAVELGKHRPLGGKPYTDWLEDKREPVEVK